MGEAADDVIDGVVCQQCGVWMPDVLNGVEPPGYPRSCRDCERMTSSYKAPPTVEKAGVPKGSPMPKVRCPRCNKACSAYGIADHLIQKHGYDR